MTITRRRFIENSIITGVGLSSGLVSKNSKKGLPKLCILHTNDVHSRIEPFPMDGGRNQGLGGAARRAALIKKIRSEEDNVLLLDSGDIFQGTPYFNFFGGELEIKLMSEMAYDLATIGNHDFDAGIDGFHKQLPHANFDFVSANYDFSNTILAGKVKTHKIFNKAGLKVGVFGLGIELKSLVPKELYKETQYNDPLVYGQRIATHLKQEEKCDLVICLSHLGYKYRENKVSDVILAQNTSDIDIILGGHTHTFMSKPDIRRNKMGDEVIINQVGWAGIMLGRLDVEFEHAQKGKCISCKNSLINS